MNEKDRIGRKEELSFAVSVWYNKIEDYENSKEYHSIIQEALLPDALIWGGSYPNSTPKEIVERDNLPIYIYAYKPIFRSLMGGIVEVPDARERAYKTAQNLLDLDFVKAVEVEKFIDPITEDSIKNNASDT